MNPNSVTAENFSLPPVPFCGSLPLRGLLWHLQHHYVVLRYCVIVGSRLCSRAPRSGSLQQRVALTLRTVFCLVHGTLPRHGPLRSSTPLCDTLSRRGSRDRTSSTTVRYLSLMSLFAPCVKCSTWAVSFCCTATRASKRVHLNSASTRLRLRAAPVRASLRRRLSAEYCETSCVRLLCGVPTCAECFEAPSPHLPRSSRAPSTSEPSRSLISSASLA